MSFTKTARKQSFSANGVTTVFNMNQVYFDDNTQISVFSLDADGNRVDYVENVDYTLTGAGDQAGGTITFGSAPANGLTVWAVRTAAIQQTTDYAQYDGMPSSVVEENFDRLVMIDQQLDETLQRSFKVDVSVTGFSGDISGMPVPGAAVIVNGDASGATFTDTDISVLQGNAAAVAADLDNIDAVAADLTNIDAVKNNATNINTVAGNNSNISTVAGISGNVTTVAGISANVTSVAGNSSNINTVAGISTDVSGVAAISTAVSAVNSNSSNINAVNSNATNINAVAGNATNINAVNSNSANINTVAGASTALSTVATNIANVNTVATNMTTITNAANNIPKANLTATVDPGVNDDGTQGYQKGSLWVNGTAGRVFIATSVSTGAAVWGNVGAYNPASVTITGGTINGTTLGATTAAAAKVTTLDASGNTTIGGTITGYLAGFNFQTGTTYTLVAGDCGKVVVCTNASAITVTLPNNLPAGFNCNVLQGGAGQVSFSAASGATLANRLSQTKIAGQEGQVNLLVKTNSGTNAAYSLSGDTGA